MITTTGEIKAIIGVDVGGSKIAVGLVSPSGQVLHAMNFKTDVHSVPATLDSIANAVQMFIRRYELTLTEDDMVGFGIPGLVDAEKGIGLASVNLNWNNVPVRSELISRLNIPCVIDNDVRVGAIGEAIYGYAKDKSFFLYLNIGTGVSTVIMIEGQIFGGVNGLAGEIGHAVMIPDGPACKCGGFGCLEAIVSGPAIALRAQEKIKMSQGNNGSFPHADAILDLSPEQVFSAAANGESYAIETIQEVGGILARVLQYLALAYDPELIVLAGGVMQGGQVMMDYVQQQLGRMAEESWVFGKIFSEELVKVSASRSHAGILGAAALVVISNNRKENTIWN